MNRGRYRCGSLRSRMKFISLALLLGSLVGCTLFKSDSEICESKGGKVRTISSCGSEGCSGGCLPSENEAFPVTGNKCQCVCCIPIDSDAKGHNTP